MLATKLFMDTKLLWLQHHPWPLSHPPQNISLTVNTPNQWQMNLVFTTFLCKRLEIQWNVCIDLSYCNIYYKHIYYSACRVREFQWPDKPACTTDNFWNHSGVRDHNGKLPSHFNICEMGQKQSQSTRLVPPCLSQYPLFPSNLHASPKKHTNTLTVSVSWPKMHSNAFTCSS